MNEIRGPMTAALPRLDTEDDIAALVSDALSRGDSAVLLDALRSLAWARFVNQLSANTGISRAQLGPMLHGQTPLTLDVAMRLLSELKLSVSVSTTPRPPSGRAVPAERTIDAGGAAYVRRF